jgi:hypothetical protein
MALRIACDLDGTIADMAGALQREAEALFGPGVDLRAGIGMPAEPPAESDIAETTETPAEPAAEKPPPIAARRGLTPREYRQLWAHVRKIENFWNTLEEIEPGSVARFAELSLRHGWEVIFLTQRPSSAGDTAQLQTKRWLAANGFELPSVFVVEGSRGLIAASLHLDAVIDDRAENCLDVATDSQAKPFLVWRESRQSAPPGAARMRIETVFSFGDVLQRLETMSAAKTSVASGLVGRIRQALGI